MQIFCKQRRRITSHADSLAAGKIAYMAEYDIDQYGRPVSVVQVDGVNVNESLIRDGYDWQYRKYCKAKFCKDWLQQERIATSAQRGLWKDSGPLPR